MLLMMAPQLVVSGVTTGMLYALIGLSMTVVYRTTTIVNFGQGDMATAGAYATLVFAVGLGLNFGVAVVLAIGVLFALGYVVQRALLRPIANAPHLALAMMALAVGYALRGGARLEWGNQFMTLPRPYPQGALALGQVVIPTDTLVIVGFVLLLLLILLVVFQATPLGRLTQAVFQSPRGAALVGINLDAFHAVAWGVGAALGAIGGVLLAIIVPLTPDLGEWVLVQGFAAMALGGFGSLGGVVVGGLLLGILEKLLGFYVNSMFIDITGYLITVVVLLVRPQGLFGRRMIVRV